MSKFEVLCVVIAALLLAGGASGQHPKKSCTYSLLTNGPTWNSDVMRVPYDVAAVAWARDGAYGGSGYSIANGFSTGGAGVAVAAVSYWFKLTHNPLPDCPAVTFVSDAKLEAEVSTKIGGDIDDYALMTGFQAASGNALLPTSLAVAATNAGQVVQSSTISVVFGMVNFTLTIPGVSVTTNTVDRDRNTSISWGSKKIEEEIITLHAWTKVRVVADGPFGGLAQASVDRTLAAASTTSSCQLHSETGFFSFDVSEG
jgi:hypothetical protein